MVSNKRSVQQLVELFKHHGINEVVISPGSRNAPLSISFEADPYFNCYNIIDERSAAFFALGISQQVRKPVAIACTSGSAAYNYAPAVAEAFYQKIPLVVITADRPPEWVHQGDGQTIVQKGIYGEHVLFSTQLNSDSLDQDSEWFNEREINEALSRATGPRKGPVHINVPFKEPLYETVEKAASPVKFIRKLHAEQSISERDMAFFQREIDESSRTLVITGMLEKNSELNDALHEFAEADSVQVITETTSNLHSARFIPSIDRLIMTFDKEEEQAFCPEILITIGNNIISKKIKALLRTHRPRQHWHIGFEDEFLDTFKSLTYQVEMDPKVFFRSFSSPKNQSDYSKVLKGRDGVNKVNHREFLDQCEWSDFVVFDRILSQIPQNSMLQMGNSSVVRYIQLFNPRNDLEYYGNRGASGIDGSTSTAAGAAVAVNKPTVLISGDVAALYDSNALWMNNFPSNLKIIVINNHGGGIFRIIDGPSSSPYLEKHFESKHNLDLKALADHAGIGYSKIHSEGELSSKLSDVFNSDNAFLLEIITPHSVNDSILKDYFRFLKRNKSKGVINK